MSAGAETDAGLPVVSAADEGGVFRVDEAACVRCGACSSLAPGVFAVRASGSCVARQPETPEDRRRATAALYNCPTTAIKRARGEPLAAHADGAAPAPVARAPLYDALAGESEAVRWALADIPWGELRPELAPPALRALVREMAFSEHATYSATQKFMQTFAADVDFTQWLAVWFYEETRHPHVLAAWLARLGEPVGADFVGRGRVSTPFMKSLTGTLVTNVISEVTAAHAYHTMAVTAREPVLAAIARRISGDEARHASAFFRFAESRIAGARDADRERLDALKVLHFWLNDSGQVTHPINQMLERLRESEAGAGQALRFDLAAVNRRVTRMVGLLVDRPFVRPEDVLPALTELTARVHARFGAGKQA